MDDLNRDILPGPFESLLSNEETGNYQGPTRDIWGIEDAQAISPKLEQQGVSHETDFQVKMESPPLFDGMSIVPKPQRVVSEPSTSYVEPKPSIDGGSAESPEVALSQTPLSEVSSTSTGKYVDERKRQIIDRVVLLFTSWLRSKFALAHQAAGESSKAPPSGGTHSAPHRRLSSSNNLNKSTKRKVGDRDNYGAGDDEDEYEEDARRTNISNAKSKEVECLRFACPYFRYNPAKYKIWRGCPGPGWPAVHRVKYVLPSSYAKLK